MKMKRSLLLILLICCLLAGCNFPSSLPNATEAWIDTPLDGSSLPMAAYEIIFHAYSAGGPRAAELTINGEPFRAEVTDQTASLQTLHYLWSPATTGRYVISVRTQDQKNVWSEPDVHIVEIGEAITQTPTLTPTLTETPTLTATLTPTETPTPSFTPTLPNGFMSYSKSGNQMGWMGLCAPDTITLSAQVSNPQTVSDVYLFVRLRSWDTGEETDWNEGFSMTEGSSGMWSINLYLGDVPRYSDFNKAILVYQFVLETGDGTLIRSPRIEDVTVGKCVERIYFP